MSIRCVCPNRHVLEVKESLAGTSGLCPTCRARVDIPQLRKQCLSEDAILDILGEDVQTPHVAGPRRIEPDEDTWLKKSHVQDTRTKQCYKCKREFPTTIHMCPFCHTYIANLRDF